MQLNANGMIIVIVHGLVRQRARHVVGLRISNIVRLSVSQKARHTDLGGQVPPHISFMGHLRCH